MSVFELFSSFSVTSSEIIRPEATVLLFLNSTLVSEVNRFWSLAQFHICADGGSNRLFDHWGSDIEQRKQYFPSVITGDLDSARTEVLEYYRKLGTEIIQNKCQDDDDLQKALKIICNHFKDKNTKFEVIILGGLGGNVTQELANFNIFYLYPQIKITFVSDSNIITLVPKGDFTIKSQTNRKCGLLPLGKAVTVTTVGLEWDVKDQQLAFGGLVSSSNVIRKSPVSVRASDSFVFSVDLRD